jgi:putative Ig domain-containing protein/glucodextranase-like protein
MLRRRSLRVTIQMVAFVTSLGVLIPTTAFAQTQNLNLAWDAPGTPDIDSYRLYVGTAPSAQDAGVYTIPASQVSYGFAATPGVLYYFAVSAVNAAGVEGPRSATVSGAIPLLSLLANRTSTVGVPIVAVQLSAYDPDGGTLRFTHTGLPPGLVLDATTGLITGTPLSTGTFTVTVFASDGLLTTSRSFDWTVRPPGSGDTTPPRISITTPTPGQTVPSTVTVSGTATDSGLGDGGIVRVTVNGQLASGGTASGSGTANWSRTVTLSGTSSTILVEAVDGAGNSAAELITVNRATSQITVTSLTSNLASPQAPGTTVRFTATAAGGTAPYQFKWWVLSNGVWNIAQNWSTSATLNWQPASSGTYTVAVWARKCRTSSRTHRPPRRAVRCRPSPA